MSRNCNNFSGGDTQYQDGSFAAWGSKPMYPSAGYFLLPQEKMNRSKHISREDLEDMKRHFDMCQDQERVQHLAERSKLKLYRRGNEGQSMLYFPEKVGDSSSSHNHGLLPSRLRRPMQYEQRYNVAPKHISLTHDILEDAFMSNYQVRERQAQARKLSEKQQFETIQTFSGLKEPSITKVHQKQPEMLLRKSRSCQKFSDFSVQDDEHRKYEICDYFSEKPKPSDKHEFGIDVESVMMKEEFHPEDSKPNEDFLDSVTVVCSASDVKERPSNTKSNLYESDGKESIRSHKTSSSRSSNKSCKTIEDSIELQRKKCSLIDVIDKSLSKSQLDKTKSDTSTKLKPQNELESSKTKVGDTCSPCSCSNPNCPKTDKEKQVDKPHNSELLTNMFKDCRVYHLQHIQEEVNRILYLEKLPEEINKSS